jgi:hypothetical protein
MWEGGYHEESLSMPDFKDVVDCIPEGGIVFVRSYFFDDFFSKVYPLFSKNLLIIGAESDFNVPFNQHIHYIKAGNNNSKV